MSQQYQIIPVNAHTWAIQDGAVRMYLLNGGTASVLIDTGYGSGDLAGVVRPLVSGGLSVINTHFHSDHISGNGQFRHFYIHEGDVEAIRPSCPAEAVIETVADREVIAVGDLRLEVIAIPGQDMEAYRNSIRKMMELSEGFDRLCPCHGELEIEKAYMEKTLNCAEEILKLGQVPAHEPEYRMNRVGVTILY